MMDEALDQISMRKSQSAISHIQTYFQQFCVSQLHVHYPQTGKHKTGVPLTDQHQGDK